MLHMVTVTLSDVVGKWFFCVLTTFLKFHWLFMHFGRDFELFSLFNYTFNAFKDKYIQFPKGDGFWFII